MPEIRTEPRAEAQAITLVVERLQLRFPQTPREVIDRAVLEAHREFDDQPIRDFVPILVERQVRDQLGGWSPPG